MRKTSCCDPFQTIVVHMCGRAEVYVPALGGPVVVDISVFPSQRITPVRAAEAQSVPDLQQAAFAPADFVSP